MLEVTKLLTELGIEYKSSGSQNVRIKCINPNHHETKPSMYIHKETGVIFCFGCGFSGNLFSLLGYKGIYGQDAFNLIKNFAKGGITEESIRNSLYKFISGRSAGKKVLEYPKVRLPQHISMPVDNYYIKSRGITTEDIKKWKIGYVTDKKYYGWVLIPIYQFSILRTYFLRSVWGSFKLYGYEVDEEGKSFGYSREDILAGLDFATNFEKKLYISEGIFDAISVSHTRNQSVASLSNRLLPKQLDILKNYKHIVVVPDNDDAGYSLVQSALSLTHVSKVSVCKLPEHRKDAGESTLEELLESTYKEIPIEEYVIAYARKKLSNI